MAKKSAKSTEVQGTNVQVENVDNKVQSSNLISKVWNGTQYKEVKAVSYEDLVQIENSMNETYKQSTKEIKDAVSLYRKSLESAVSDIEKLYKGVTKGSLFGVDIDVKKHLDILVRLSGVEVEKLFDVKFVASLFDVYTFDNKESGVQTLKAVRCRKTDKTDYAKLESSAEKVGFYIDIAGTEHTEKDKVYYWKPITNFTANVVLKAVFALNNESIFRIEKAAIKAAKKAEARKARKAAKKAEKAGTEVQAEETK